jgi:glycosyltransferase involved in cell wall biosynthesis
MPGWDLEIAGDGPDKERLEGIIAGYGLQERVELLGNLPRTELLGRISRAHIFALLSSFESFSFQVVEALHAGAPVIAADIGNLREIIADGQDGLLIPANDPQAFIEAVKKISDDKALADRLAKNGAEKARTFSIEKTLDALVRVFERFVAAK